MDKCIVCGEETNAYLGQGEDIEGRPYCYPHMVNELLKDCDAYEEQVTTLRKQVEESTKELSVAKHRVEELERENTSLKNEIYTLKISNNVLITSKAQLVEGLRGMEMVYKNGATEVVLIEIARSLLEGGSDD